MQLLTTAAAFLLLAGTCWAKPPAEAVDPDTAQWYQSLKQPSTGSSCCDISDCRPTELRPSPNAADRWQAYISKKVFGPGAPDDWLDIPNDRMLRKINNPTGRVVICWFNGNILCAVLPSLT